MNKTKILEPFYTNPRYHEFTKINKFEILFHNKNA